jgi:Zn-dependent membrane protease YugP
MIGSRLWFLPFVIGAMLYYSGRAMGQPLMWAGIILFSAVVLFQIVTLPTEINASNRAKAVLASSGIVTTQEEALGVSKVLTAAAMTYVAATVASILQLIDLVLRTQRRD